MSKYCIFSVLLLLVLTSTFTNTIAGGQNMSHNVSDPVAEVSVQLEPTGKVTGIDAVKKVENTGRDLLAKQFPNDMSKSAKVIGKITFLNKQDKESIFELSGLFLYRETYTAVTHKVIFSMSGDACKVISVDGKEQ
jgi:hypothetical protein